MAYKTGRSAMSDLIFEEIQGNLNNQYPETYLQYYKNESPLIGTFRGKVPSKFAGHDYLIELDSGPIVKLLRVKDLAEKMDQVTEGAYVAIFCKNKLNLQNGSTKYIAAVMVGRKAS